VVFANPGTSFIEAGRVAVQVLSKPVYCQGTECFLGTLAQCRGTSLFGAGKLSQYGIFIGGTGPAEAGVQTISEPEICHDAGFILRTDARVRVQEPLQICLECRSKSKKCDEQLTHIVRVSLRFYFLNL
jgi:hypothetical protein